MVASSDAGALITLGAARGGGALLHTHDNCINVIKVSTNRDDSFIVLHTSRKSSLRVLRLRLGRPKSSSFLEMELKKRYDREKK